MSDVKVRLLEETDLPAVLEIYRANTAASEEEAQELEKTIIGAIEFGDPLASLAAELNEKFAGFMVAIPEMRTYGLGKGVGWIKLLGVRPDCKGKGVGRALGEAILEHFSNSGIKEIRTLVDWDDHELIPFFQDLGFDKSKMIVLEKNID
ncbi:MAG: GNAT family N-acetyltransferase [Candidatus Heimdallarchaeota archaeon]